MLLHTLVALVSLAFSILVGWLFPAKTYWLTAALGFVLASAGIFGRYGFLRNPDGAPATAWVPANLLLAAIIGVLWPASPLTLSYWSHPSRRVIDDDYGGNP